MDLHQTIRKNSYGTHHKEGNVKAMDRQTRVNRAHNSTMQRGLREERRFSLVEARRRLRKQTQGTRASIRPAVCPLFIARQPRGPCPPTSCLTPVVARRVRGFSHGRVELCRCLQGNLPATNPHLQLVLQLSLVLRDLAFQLFQVIERLVHFDVLIGGQFSAGRNGRTVLGPPHKVAFRNLVLGALLHQLQCSFFKSTDKAIFLAVRILTVESLLAVVVPQP